MATGTRMAPLRTLQNIAAADPLRALQSRMNQLFDDVSGSLAYPGEESFSLSAWSPFCDIYETDKEIIVKAELPELKKQDLHVHVENNVLTISGERKFEEETAQENYHRIERRYGKFLRSFALPATIDSSKVSAEFKDGVLRVALPITGQAKHKLEVRIK